MKSLDMQPIFNEPALFDKNKKILVVADLHIGIEAELRERGLNTASQTHNMINHLVSLCKKYRPEEIVMLGDIKHNIPSSTIEERKDVEDLLEKVQRYGIIHILPGNHDGNIRKIAPEDVIIHPSNGIVFDDIGFVHGHRWPNSKIMQCKQIIIGHTHPTIMLTDRLGYKKFEPCWLKVNLIEGKLKEKYPNSADPQVLVIPAFNPLCGGIAANKEGVTGPIGKIMDIENAQVYLLDGSCLGKVKNIK